MSRNARNYLQSSLFHVMIQGVNREYILDSQFYKSTYLKLLKNYVVEFNVNVIAYCIMSNHVHLLINTEEIIELSKFMHKVNTNYALIYNKINNRVGHLFRNRFKSEPIKNIRHLFCCINYIHNNPVKACICRGKEDYEFSSYREYLYKKTVIDEQILKQYLGENYIHELFNNSKEEEFTFIEDEDDRNVIVNNIIDEYLEKNGSIVSVKNNNNELRRLIRRLQHNGCSYRIMEEKLKIGRERLRRIVRKNETEKL